MPTTSSLYADAELLTHISLKNVFFNWIFINFVKFRAYIVAEVPGLACVDDVGHVVALVGRVDVEPLGVDLALAGRVRAHVGVGCRGEGRVSETSPETRNRK